MTILCVLDTREEKTSDFLVWGLFLDARQNRFLDEDFLDEGIIR